MFASLLPKGAPFFELLLQQNQILCQIVEALVAILEDRACITTQHRKITALEEEGDALHLAVSKHLSLTFITPIDREDLLHINQEQEEAIDLFHDTANRLYIFEVDRVRFPMLQLMRTLKELVLLTRSMLTGLSQKRDSHDTKTFRAHRNECEMLLNMGLVELHDVEDPSVKDLLSILKCSQTYGRLELAVRQVVKLAEAIEEAVLKNV